MKSINGLVLGVILIIIVLIMAPLIITANADITGHANISIFTGLSSVGAIGPIIMLLGLLTSAGFFTFGGVKGGNATRKDLIMVVGSVIGLVIALTLYAVVLTQVAVLVVATTAASLTSVTTIVEILPLIGYVGIIAGVGWVQVKAYRRMRRGYVVR